MRFGEGLHSKRSQLMDKWSSRAKLAIMRSSAYLGARDWMLKSGHRAYWVVREDLARRYLRGTGIEIGALTAPLRVPAGVEVRYVDRLPREELVRLDGPSLRSSGEDPELIVHVDVVADATSLSGVETNSVDFVIAVHVLEHLEDPIRGLTNMLRATRPGGQVLLVLPDPRFTFDRKRQRTTVDHVLRDHEEGPGWSRCEHYREWARDIEEVPAGQLDERARQFEAQDARHHFHVWELTDFLRMLLAADLPCEIVHTQSYLNEYAVVLTARAD